MWKWGRGVRQKNKTKQKTWHDRTHGEKRPVSWPWKKVINHAHAENYHTQTKRKKNNHFPWNHIKRRRTGLWIWSNETSLLLYNAKLIFVPFHFSGLYDVSDVVTCALVRVGSKQGDIFSLWMVLASPGQICQLDWHWWSHSWFGPRSGWGGVPGQGGVFMCGATLGPVPLCRVCGAGRLGKQEVVAA